METRILMAYASTHGATQEVAEDMAAVLRENGLAVDVRPARSVKTLEGYRAVVLGAPLYMFHWHKDALRFLSRHQKAITGGLPVAVFAGGPIEKKTANDLPEVRSQLDKELAKFAWFRPASVEIVGGRFDPTALRFPWNLIPALKQMPPTDFRDWTAIRAWANTLSAQFSDVRQDRQPAAA